MPTTKVAIPLQCLASIDRFIRLNPNHPDLDYAYYMRGLSNIKADENSFPGVFRRRQS